MNTPRARKRRTHLLAAALASPAIGLANPVLEETVVTATLLPEDAGRLAVTVFNQAEVTQRSAQHLEDLLSAAPNVNAASGASRSRFFQIRGVGERSQFTEPLNASIAMLLDGIDLTGIGAAATTWDLQQIEILRGPQGTLFGANALAGLINLQSTPADAGDPLRLSAGIENYGGRRLGLAAGSELAEDWHGRIALQNYQSDGYISNQWLDRDDSNNRDETTARLGLSWLGNSQRVDMNVYRLDVDNGYDAFSLDNTRSTLSDQPGKDKSLTDAARLRWQREGRINLMTQISYADTRTEYSYDEDWSYVGIAPGWEYSSFDRYDRDRRMGSVEIRINGRWNQLDWVAGTYLRREDETFTRRYTYLETPFSSDLAIDTEALFGQVALSITPTVSLHAGLRTETRATDYTDSQGVNQSLDTSLWSGRAGLEWQVTDNHRIFLNSARGVRAGGVNAALLASTQTLPTASAALSGLGFFDEEALLNTELGWRWRNSDSRVESALTVFVMSRQDQQVRQSLTLPRPDGSTAFIDYTDNAARGRNQGVEWSGRWQATASLQVRASLGVLETEYIDYVTAEGEDLSGREQPQAPRSMGQFAVNWTPIDAWSAGLEVTSMDSYFFSDRHETRSPSRTLLNGHVAWQHQDWRIQVWGRNLLNEDYFVRGFGSFGNDPRKEYILEPYFQFGEPRVIGVTVDYQP